MATVPNQLQTQQINGRTYYLDGNNWVDAYGHAADPQATDPNTNPSYTQGVTAQSLIDPTVTNTYNPQQLATPETAAKIAQQTGLKQGQSSLEGPGVPDTPIQQVGSSNAGLAQGVIDRYGPPTPGSYSEYLIQRDQPGNGGTSEFGSYSNYYNSPQQQAAIKQAQAAQAAQGQGTKQSIALPPGGGLTGSAPGGTYTGSISPTGTPGSRSTGVPQTPGSAPVLPYRNGSSAWALPPTPFPSTTPPPTSGGGTAPPGGSPAPSGGGATAPPPYVRQSVQGPGIPGTTGPAQAPNAGYAPRPNPASFTGGTGNPYPLGVQPILRQDNGEGLQYKTENDRALALQRGEALNTDLQAYGDQQYAQAGDFSDLQGAAYSGIASGNGGYSGDEKNAILRQDELNSLQQTPEEAQQNYLTQQEQAGIKGDPMAAYHQLGTDEAGVDLAANTRDQFARGQFNAGKDATNAALGDQKNMLRAVYTAEGNSTRNAIGDEATRTRSYVNPAALNTSAEYNSAYNFGDRDAQNIVDKAGRTVNAQSRADEDRLLSDANANGNTSPLAIQAARDRIRQTGGVNSADAMTDARINAKQLALQTAQNKENTRLGAAQNYAQLGTGVEQNLGQQSLSNEQNLGAAAIGAESYLGDQNVKAQQAIGQQGTQLEKDIGQSHIDVGTKGTEMNLAAGQAMDAANSARAGQIATNRQATSKSNQDTQYTRGKTAYDAESAANTNFANQRLGTEAEYRKTLGDRQSQASQNTTIANQQRIGNYGTQTGAVNTASGNAINNSKTPGLGIQIAGLFKRGGVVAHGQKAIVGEAGPELIIRPREVHENYAQYPHCGGGGMFGDSMDGYSDPNAMSGVGDIEAADSQYSTPIDKEAQRNGYDRAPNPLYKTILSDLGQFHSGGPNSTSDPGGYKKSGPGYLSQFAMLGLAAKGGVFGAPETEDSYIAPGIELVDGPQLKTLGARGTEIVAPLTPRKSNKVKLSQLPELIQEYGSYAR